MCVLFPSHETAGQPPKARPTSPATVIGQTPSPSPKALSKEDIEIAVGDRYRKEGNYKEADAAYLRALQSAGATAAIRRKASESIDKSLRERHDIWLALKHATIETFEKPIHLIPLFILFVGLWLFTGFVGRERGKYRLLIDDLDKDNPGFAPTFRLAYHRATEADRATPARSGILTERPVSVYVEPQLSTDELTELLSALSPDAGRVLSLFLGRLLEPRFRLSVASREDSTSTWVMVNLAAAGKVVETWNEPISHNDLFEPGCVLLTEIVAVVESEAR